MALVQAKKTRFYVSGQKYFPKWCGDAGFFFFSYFLFLVENILKSGAANKIARREAKRRGKKREWEKKHLKKKNKKKTAGDILEIDARANKIQCDAHTSE